MAGPIRTYQTVRGHPTAGSITRAEEFILGVVFDVESTGGLGFGSKRRNGADIVKLYLTRVIGPGGKTSASHRYR